jgi:ATP-binding cassette subfamily B multidrug efflux pump
MNGLLIVGTTGLALWLWSQSLISVGAIALATGLVIRIVNMSGWIMWVVNGIFENIGMVQDGMQTIAIRARWWTSPLPRPCGWSAAACASRMSASLRQRRGRDPGLQLDAPGREDRPGRPVRRRQVDPGQPAAAPVRPARRPHPHRRPGHRQRDPGKPARTDRHDHPGHLAAAPLDPRQPAVRPPGASEDDLGAVRKARADEFIPQLSTPRAAPVSMPTSASAA